MVAVTLSLNVIVLKRSKHEHNMNNITGVNKGHINHFLTGWKCYPQNYHTESVIVSPILI